MTNMEAPLTKRGTSAVFGDSSFPAFFAVALYSHIKLMYNVFFKKLHAIYIKKIIQEFVFGKT